MFGKDIDRHLTPSFCHLSPFVGCKGSQTSFRIRKGQAVNRLEQFLPPLESKQLQNLFLFIGLA